MFSIRFITLLVAICYLVNLDKSMAKFQSNNFIENWIKLYFTLYYQ